MKTTSKREHRKTTGSTGKGGEEQLWRRGSEIMREIRWAEGETMAE